MMNVAQARFLLDKASSCLAMMEAKADADPARLQACLTELDSVLRLLKGFGALYPTLRRLLEYKVRQHTTAAALAQLLFIACPHNIPAALC
jgi:predicted component of type VI protein secretion system